MMVSPDSNISTKGSIEAHWPQNLLAQQFQTICAFEIRHAVAVFLGNFVSTRHQVRRSRVYQDRNDILCGIAGFRCKLGVTFGREFAIMKMV